MNLIYRLCVVILLGIDLCWNAKQEERIQNLQIRVIELQDTVDNHEDFLKDDYKNINQLLEERSLTAGQPLFLFKK